MKIECRAPLRIDLAGGWSDIPPFASREGGAVLNAAIAHYVTGHVVTATPSIDGTGGASADPDAAHQSLHLSYGLDLPTGAGLGSSASLSVAWLALIHATMGTLAQDQAAGHAPEQVLRRDAQRRLAREACDLATLLGLLGGKQDEYAAAVGGVNLMRFGHGHDVEIDSLDLSPEVRRGLEERLILCYSGKARLSGDIHDRVWGACERGDSVILRTLAELRDVALAMREALTAGDFESVAAGLRRNWEAQQRLHPSMTNVEVDALFDAARAAGADAGKACGAGGGGCLVFLAEPRVAAGVRAALAAHGAQLIESHIDWDGVVVREV